MIWEVLPSYRLYEAATGESANPWLVVWAESRAEKKVEKRIAALGIRPWLPVVTERHRWSDRWKQVERPLFPGYLFAQAGSTDWPAILRTPGVLSVVKQGGRPAVLDHSFVTSLRDAIGRAGATPEPLAEQPRFLAGEEVIVQEGPLRGVRGVVQERRSGRRLVIWVAAVGRGVAFTIGAALVRAAPPTPTA